MESTSELELANQIIRQTNQNLFLTGKAGTGKTTFLKSLQADLPKRMVVLAPTGVAAINAGGMTIHSFFQFKPTIFTPNQINREVKQIRKEKLNIIRTLELLVIDEISMVRADLLDEIDDTLRNIRHSNVPFGGVQLLMIGDIQQLSPVVRDEDWKILQNFYESPYFFDSLALKKSDYTYIELQKVFRQSDATFINLLNQVRDNNVSKKCLAELNKRYIPNFQNTNNEYIQLTSHNRIAQSINTAELQKLIGRTYTFYATLKGDFTESNAPTDCTLNLKVGARVMFLKNDSSYERRFYNGKIGVVDDFYTIDGVENIIVSDLENGGKIFVVPETWENIKYKLNPETNEIEEYVTGSFTQYPLKTAWAITIHKSQGLTFDHAIIDAQNSFSHGQVYVALSRCRTLEGLVLSSPLTLQSFVHDPRLDGFSSEAQERIATSNHLDDFRRKFFLQLAQEMFNFEDLNHALYQLRAFLAANYMNKTPILITNIMNAETSFHGSILDVSRKFIIQLQEICSDHPQDYMEVANLRIEKALRYFLKALPPLVSLLSQFDQTQTRREPDDERLNDLKFNFIYALGLKGFLFKKFINEDLQFSTSTYLRERNNIILKLERQHIEKPIVSPRQSFSNNDNEYSTSSEYSNSRSKTSSKSTSKKPKKSKDKTTNAKKRNEGTGKKRNPKDKSLKES